VNDFDEKLLKANLAASPPPPLSPALRAAIAAVTPVRTRARLGAFAVVLVAGVLWPLVAIGRGELRGDLGALPSWWVVAGAVLWAAAFVGGGLRQVDILKSDLAATPWPSRLQLLREHLFPPASYMRQRFPRCPSMLLPLAYACRILVGAPRWVRR